MNTLGLCGERRGVIDGRLEAPWNGGVWDAEKLLDTWVRAVHCALDGALVRHYDGRGCGPGCLQEEKTYERACHFKLNHASWEPKLK